MQLLAISFDSSNWRQNHTNISGYLGMCKIIQIFYMFWMQKIFYLHIGTSWYLLFVSVGFSSVCSSSNNGLAAAAGALLQPCLVTVTACFSYFVMSLSISLTHTMQITVSLKLLLYYLAFISSIIRTTIVLFSVHSNKQTCRIKISKNQPL
jgi:hypothetical protein